MPRINPYSNRENERLTIEQKNILDRYYDKNIYHPDLIAFGDWKILCSYGEYEELWHDCSNYLQAKRWERDTKNRQRIFGDGGFVFPTHNWILNNSNVDNGIEETHGDEEEGDLDIF